MKNLTLVEKALVGLGLLAGLTNPFTGAVILQGIDWVFQQGFVYVSPYAGPVFTVSFAIYMVVRNRKAEKVNVPSKSHKAKSSKFIATPVV